MSIFGKQFSVIYRFLDGMLLYPMKINMKILVYIYLVFGIVLISCKSKNKKWREWIIENSHSIDISDTTNYQDLGFLKDLLKDKRIVFLGESGHGVAEYTILKSRIIRYLHEEMNFDILAFESNAADGFAADYFNSYQNVDSTIYNSISTLWHVEQIVPLFRYINSTHSTDDLLIVQGVDITLSNGSFAFSRFLYKLILQINPVYAIEIMQKDSIFSAFGVKKWTIGNLFTADERELYRNLSKERLTDYTSLKKYIEENRHQFPEGYDREIGAALFYLQSRIDFIHWSNHDSLYMANAFKGTEYKIKSESKLFSAYRDYLMAQNLQFLAKYLFPEKKIIVWGQNAHIKKYPFRMYAELNKFAPSYSIGIFSYSGEGDWTFGQGFDGTNPDSMIYQFKTPQDALSIAQLLHASGHDITFIDMLNHKETEGNSWMFKIAKIHDWDGSNLEEEENIRNTWDALILINSTTTPKYLEFQYDYLDNNIKGYNKR